MDRGIARWISYWALAQPDRPAVVFEGRQTTYAQLAHRMEAVAESLRARGVGPGDRVLVLLPNRPEFYDVFFGIARLGAVFVPVSNRLTAAEIGHVAHDSGAVLLVTEPGSADVVERIAGGPPAVHADDLVDAVPGRLPWPDRSDLLAVLYTSGTTGRPKGAMLTHSAVDYAARDLVHMNGYTQDDRHLVVLPLSFTGGIITLSQPVFLSGGTVVLEAGFDPARTLTVLAAERVTVFFAAPALLQLLRLQEGFGAEPFRTVRLIVAGAAPVPRPLLETYHALDVNVSQGYGLTESGSIATCLMPHETAARIGSVGRACLFTEVRIADEAGRSVSAGTRGEILLRSAHLMSGYWEDEAATAAAMVDGWLRTGDVGLLDDDGYLYVVDRLTDIVITGGLNVYPAEVEAVVFGHPAVAEVAVIGVPHPVYGETVTAVVVTRPGSHIDLDELRAFCAPVLADYKVPRRLEVVDALPRNTSGKVLKFRLRDDIGGVKADAGPA